MRNKSSVNDNSKFKDFSDFGNLMVNITNCYMVQEEDIVLCRTENFWVEEHE